MSATVGRVMLAVALGIGARSLPAGGVVTECTETAFNAALAGGGTVSFACNGTILFSASKVVTLDTTLDGNGHAVVLDGGGAVQLFRVTAAAFTIRGLTMQNGLSRGVAAFTDPPNIQCWPTTATAGRGGAVDNEGGVVRIEDSTLQGNRATGGNGGAPGWGCAGNPPPADPGAGSGGAVYSQGGSLTLLRVKLFNNQATGGGGIGGANGSNTCTPGYAGGPGGAGEGGAIYATGKLEIRDTLFSGNLAQGGLGGIGVGPNFPGHGCWPGGPAGGAGRAGALFAFPPPGAPSALVVNTAFMGNRAAGAPGGNGLNCCGVIVSAGSGGAASGGAVLSAGALALRGVVVDGNRAGGGAAGTDPGAGAPGGAAIGGGWLISSSNATLDDATFAANLAVSGTGNAATPAPFADTVELSGGSLAAANSVLWQAARTDSLHISTGSATVDYSDLPVRWSGGGSGNISRDPLFANPLGPDGIAGTADDDLRPAPGSPLIDAGSNFRVPAGLTTDIAGRPRFLDDPATFDTGAGIAPIVDIGAHEFAADSDRDGWPDYLDCAPLDPTLWQPPSEARALVFSGDRIYLAWLAPASPGATAAPVYDLLRATAAADFMNAACAASGITATRAADPATGSGFFLVRARNPCGGTLGVDSAGRSISGRTCP